MIDFRRIITSGKGRSQWPEIRGKAQDCLSRPDIRPFMAKKRRQISAPFRSISFAYCFGGHSGEGSVAASGFFPHEAAKRAVRAAKRLSIIWEIKFLLVSIGSPLILIWQGIFSFTQNGGQDSRGYHSIVNILLKSQEGQEGNNLYTRHPINEYQEEKADIRIPRLFSNSPAVLALRERRKARTSTDFLS